MVLERFLSWVAAAPAAARADAARALIAAYSRLDADRLLRENLDRMTAVLLDDPVMAVRYALSDAAATSRDVPRPLVVALSRDCTAVATPVLRCSSLLTAVDLVEAMAVADETGHAAIASRAAVPAAAADALARDAGLGGVLTLCRNAGAEIAPATLRRILDRFGHDGAIREALLGRDDLEPALRHELVVATAAALTDFAVARGWMAERRAQCVRRESSEKAAVTVAALQARRPSAPTLAPFVGHLRAAGLLTPALLLRSLLSGETGLFHAALAELGGMSPARARGIASAPSSLAFASLYARAAMPIALLPAFRAALATAQRRLPETPAGFAVNPVAVAHVRADCAAFREQPGLLALLDRLEAEALRDDVRRRRDPGPQQRAEPPALIWLAPRRPALRAPFRSAA